MHSALLYTAPGACLRYHSRHCYVLSAWVYCAGVQVSLEDAEVLLGTAERTNIAGQANCVPYKVTHAAAGC